MKYIFAALYVGCFAWSGSWLVAAIDTAAVVLPYLAIRAISRRVSQRGIQRLS